MKVKCPPLHVEGAHEKKIFNDFMAEHPKPTSKHWKELAKLYKARTNCKTVFPKLPSMLKSYYNHWQDSQAIVMAEEEMKSEYRALLFKLATPGRGTTSVAIQQQISAQGELSKGIDMIVDMDDLCEDPLPVPPPAAPGQSLFVQSAGGKKKDQRCCYFPCCSKMASKCHGYFAVMCNEVNSGRVVFTAEELAEKKAVAKREEAAARARKQRQLAKRQRVEMNKEAPL